MQRTTIVLPADLKRRAMRLASRRGVSFSEAVRQALKAFIEGAEEPGERDPLFADRAVFEGRAPADLSERHDDYLYK